MMWGKHALSVKLTDKEKLTGDRRSFVPMFEGRLLPPRYATRRDRRHLKEVVAFIPLGLLYPLRARANAIWGAVLRQHTFPCASGVVRAARPRFMLRRGSLSFRCSLERHPARRVRHRALGCGHVDASRQQDKGRRRRAPPYRRGTAGRRIVTHQS